jgi:hypothetical protein
MDTGAGEGQEGITIEFTQTLTAVVKKIAAKRMQETPREQVARQWATRKIRYGNQGLDWITFEQLLNHRKKDGKRKAALMQLPFRCADEG